jgi:hypothetical protein
MKVTRERLAIVLFCLLGSAMTGVMNGQDAAERANAAILPPRENREILDLMHTMQELAKQSEVELKRSREQNERLQQLLEQTRQELTRLREEMELLRSSVSPSRPAVPSPISPESNGDAGNQDDSDDGLTARLTRAEERVDLNTAQIIEQAQTKVESESRFKVHLFGTVLSNTYFNTSNSSNSAVPTVAPPQIESGGHSLGATFRQTQIGFSMTGPTLGAARLSAGVDFDFFGGVADGYNQNVMGALRMRTASVRLDGSRTSLAIGLMTPLISSLNPNSLAAVSYPALGESGNLWQWLPQVTTERRIMVREDTDLILQGGLIIPFGETANGVALAGRPGYESRIAYATRLTGDRRLEIGVGGYFQPRNLGFGRTVNSYAATSDWQLPLTRRFELSGEAFYGQTLSLSMQSGADIASVLSFHGSLSDPLTTVRGVHSAGGWTQLNAIATGKLDFNVAFGLDDPRNRDIYAGQVSYDVRLKNETFSINSIFRFRSNFLVSAEYRRLWTAYPYIQTTNNHINLAVGYLF